MREAFARQSAVDLCDSTDSSRRNSEEIFDGPYYSTIDDLSSDGGYFSPAETSPTVIQLNQEVHIDQSRLLSSTSASTSSAQEDISYEAKETKESITIGQTIGQTTCQTEAKATSNQQQKEEVQEEEKETPVSVLLSSSSMCDGVLRMREDLLVGCDNMSNVNICRLDDLRETIARLRKETQILEETDMILKTKIAYVAGRRVQVRQDILDDMASWEFV